MSLDKRLAALEVGLTGTDERREASMKWLQEQVEGCPARPAPTPAQKKEAARFLASLGWPHVA